ncbi:MAG TPA: hypothetical protein VGX78_18555 [Pirellulales bacterium]|jgi:hypothetical protein|nr:hypothetical protein [Pirellulales bacterium]
MSICTASDVTAYLGLPAMNALASLVQTLAEGHVKDHLGVQELEQQTWVEFYPLDHAHANQPGDPHYIVDSAHRRAVPGFYLAPNIVQLRQLPVRSITEVREDATGYFGQVAGSFGAATVLVAGSDYYLKQEQSGLSWTGHLVRRSFWFPAIAGSVMVTYVSGFTAAEFAGRWSVFKTACLETIGDLYLRAKALAGGQKADLGGEAIGGGVNMTYLQNNLSGATVPDRVAELLQPFVNYGAMAL